MSNKFTCKHCHEEFTPDKDTLQLLEEGCIDPPDTCDECFDMSEPNYPLDKEDRTGADIGL